jgi:hypothetical protein
MEGFHISLIRKIESDMGTFGRLLAPELSLCTAELPWRDNKSRISRIPPGVYKCAPYSSAKFPNVYKVCDVPEREDILFHTGNFSGDVAKGYKSDVLGCILVGTRMGNADGQDCIAFGCSAPGMNILRACLGKNNFVLEITEEFPK